MIAAIVERCAGIDVGKSELAVCLMVGAAADEPQVEYRRFLTFHRNLCELRDWLTQSGCTHVLMESTGPYWKPVFNVLETAVTVALANAEDVKGRKGHKTDKEDSWWLAHLFRHGMVRSSFIPPRPVRELRDLTRRRAQLLHMATSEKNRVQKVLEDANVKLGSVLSDVFGVSGQRMLEALLEGHAGPEEIAQMARSRAKRKVPELVAALEGSQMSAHHRVMIRMSVEVLRCLEQQLIQLDTRILEQIQQAGLMPQLQLIESVPGVQRNSAVVLLAETGGDMTVFGTAGRLSSWTGVCPGNKRSAGKDFRGHTTRGNRWLRAALTECAWGASHAKQGVFRDQFWRLAVASKKRAVIAVAHSLLVAVFRVLVAGKPYSPASGNPNPEQAQRLIRHHIRCLGRLGVCVGLRYADDHRKKHLPAPC
jgi:transposase